MPLSRQTFKLVKIQARNMIQVLFNTVLRIEINVVTLSYGAIPVEALPVVPVVTFPVVPVVPVVTFPVVPVVPVVTFPVVPVVPVVTFPVVPVVPVVAFPVVPVVAAALNCPTRVIVSTANVTAVCPLHYLILHRNCLTLNASSDIHFVDVPMS